jgi:4-amino-4-deoxy-L-arabinose transferase-like glycosyltransferase
MNKTLLIILFLASLFRLVSLDKHVDALYGDEVSIAYNAYSILTTGRDEFGVFMPLQFESWGDQKNPVYIYLVSFVQIFTGLSEYSVRLPSAIAGIFAVYLTYLLVVKLAEVTNAYPTLRKRIALASAALLTISPWHIHISRGGYEANLALTLGLASIYFLLNYFQSFKNKYLIYSLIPSVLAIYTYYTTKMFLPILLIVTFIWGYFITKKSVSAKIYLKSSIFYILSFIFLSLPVIYLALFSNGQARFASINIFTNATVAQRVIETRPMITDESLKKLLINKPYIWTRDFLEYYFDNLSPQFWYVAGDSSLRYNIGNHGMFYLIEFPLFVAGLLFLFQRNKKLFGLLVLWLLLAPLPTALVGKSYGLRSLAILPIPMILSSIGIFELSERLKRYRLLNFRLSTFFFSLLSLVFLVSFANWALRYIFYYPTYAYNWYDGMQKDAVNAAINQSDKYDNVIISRYYGKTEMYFAYYSKMSPAEYQKLSQEKSTIGGQEMIKFGKYYFGDLNQKNLQQLPPKTLLIVSPLATYGYSEITAREDNRIMFKAETSE